MIVPTKYTTPVLTAKTVQYLQEILETITWLDYVFPLVKVGKVKDKTVPVCYKNDGSKTMLTVYPDSKVGALAFFEIEGATSIPDDEDNWYINSLSVTVWFNMDLCLSKEYDYTHELIEDVKDALDSGNCHDYELEERPSEIFDKFTSLVEEDYQFLMPPYGAFKLKFTIEK